MSSLEGAAGFRGLRCCVRLRVGVTGKGCAAGGPCVDPQRVLPGLLQTGPRGLQW